MARISNQYWHETKSCKSATISRTSSMDALVLFKYISCIISLRYFFLYWESSQTKKTTWQCFLIKSVWPHEVQFDEREFFEFMDDKGILVQLSPCNRVMMVRFYIIYDIQWVNGSISMRKLSDATWFTLMLHCWFAWGLLQKRDSRSIFVYIYIWIYIYIYGYIYKSTNENLKRNAGVVCEICRCCLHLLSFWNRL